jgi:dienelactone hydrolase
MSLFRRALAWLFLLSGIVAGLAGSIAIFFARRMTNPPRQRLWATPRDLQLGYEEAQFKAQDGVGLKGWFIPAGSDSSRKGAAIILVHGWLWNRLGEPAEDALSKIIGATPVDLLRLAFSLHQEGYHVFMFDLRNHGESMSASPVTFGWQESNDLLGALAYLNSRSDVDAERIGVIGFSMGANTLLQTLPRTELIKAAIAVQPATLSLLAKRFGADILGPLSKLVVPLIELLYKAAGGPPFSSFAPDFSAASAGRTPVLYVQSTGDRWGSVDDVAQMVSSSPSARGPLHVDATDRFGGYQYVIDNPKIAAAFFEQLFPE